MSALVTNIQGYSIHDGPGIRTVVFLKGCALKCQWCSNPECISAHSEVGVFKSLCTLCGKCAGVCLPKALTCIKGQPPSIDRRICTGCGACSAVCSYKALVLYGRPMTSEEIFEGLRRDEIFYQASGGGVTVSGGEALLQPRLVSQLLSQCRRAGINTCIETSGCASEASLREVLQYTDYVLYDLKHLNNEKHRYYTGQPNDLILSNARIVAQSGIEMLFRLPLIPGVNDDCENIRETAAFLLELGARSSRIELMPYHRLGKGKYDSLEKEYPLADLAVHGAEELEKVKKSFEDLGIACSISR